MFGPGEYICDVTQGITCVEDLPKPKLVQRSRNFKRRTCPDCQQSAYRVRVCTRSLHDLGDPLTGRSRGLVITHSRHLCPNCNRYFNADMDDLAMPKSHYAHRAVALAVRLVVEDGLPYRSACWHLWRDHRVFVPWATIQNWVEGMGKKAESSVQTKYLDDALEQFSGCIASDELDDGPFCVPCIVDKRQFRRLHYEVLDHDPTNEDITRFFGRFKQVLDARGLTVTGITSDGSSLYPEAIKTVFGEILHQTCEFHVIREVVKAVLKVITHACKELKRQKAKCPRGSPSGTKAKRAARNNKRIQSKIACVNTGIYL